MPRRPRYFEDGSVYHLIQRGNNKADIFFNHDDYLVFLKYLRESKQEYPCFIYAYCLMTNHLHLLIQAIKSFNISNFMKYVTCKYSRYVNAKYNRSGTLFGGRFKAGLVQHEIYFANCMKYIECNPVRARIVQSPEQYPWSSYHFHTKNEASTLLDYDHLSLSLDKDIQECRLKYKEFVTGQTEDDSVINLIRERTNQCGVIGTDDYVKQMESRTGIDLKCHLPGRKPKDQKQLSYPQSY